MCRRALSVCAAVPQSSGFEWTSACCVRYTHLSSYNPSPMAACMRHVHKHNLSPAARQSRGRTSGPAPRATHIHTDTRARVATRTKTDAKTTDESASERRAHCGALVGEALQRRHAGCVTTLFTLSCLEPRSPHTGGSQTERVTPLALALARAVTPIEKTPCLHSHAYLLVHFSAKMPFT